MKLLFCALGAWTLLGADYYVSAVGSDQQSGSRTQPWATLDPVNRMCFAPGDRLYFKGGQTFSGRIRLNSNCDLSGLITAPIALNSYGTGRATITGGFEAYDKGGIVLQNLIFRNTAAGNTEDGVAFHITRRDHVDRSVIRMYNVEVSGFGGFGVTFGSWYPDSGGFIDVSLKNVVSFNNPKGGIVSWGPEGALLYKHKKIYVGYSTAYDNSGYKLADFPAGWRPQGTGNGILLGSVDGGVIEYSSAYNNGANNDYIDGPVGIMVFDSRRMVIQQCTSYLNKTLVNDGNGFSFDRNTSDSIMQNNWSWDNYGVGLYLAQNVDQPYHFNNVVRYNSSQNDGRRGSYAGLSIWGPVRNAKIYNNQVTIGPNDNGVPRAVALSNYYLPRTYIHNIVVQNNVFETRGNATMISAEASLLSGSTGIIFKGNTYLAESLKIVWGNHAFFSLDAWKSATLMER